MNNKASETATLIVPEWLAPVARTDTHGDARPDPEVLRGQAVLTRNDCIAAVGPESELRAMARDWEQRAEVSHVHVVERPHSLLIPGLVNAHTHAAMWLLRGVGDDLPLQPWLEQRIWPLESALVSEDFVFDGTLLAAHEMVLGGVTCFHDMYFFPDAACRAASEIGVRIVAGIVAFEFPTAYGTGADDYLDKGLATLDLWRDDPRTHFCFGPHAPYTVSDRSFERIARLASELELPVLTHLHETEREIADSIREHGQRPVARLDRLGLVNRDFVGVHGVYLNDEDLAILGRAGAGIVHCPHSNLKLGSGLPAIRRMLDHGLTLAIGTDGAASNNRLDLLADGRTAALLAKGIERDAAVLPSAALMHALTWGGARALGLDSEIGSIECGKKADLVLARLPPGAYGFVADPVSTLIHSAGREAISDVWVDGRHVVSERQIGPSMSRSSVGSALARIPLWHNRLGEFVPDRTV